MKTTGEEIAAPVHLILWREIRYTTLNPARRTALSRGTHVMTDWEST